MHIQRHHHVLPLALLPIFLLLLAPQWGKASMAPTLAHYNALADRSEQEMMLLESKFENTQRALHLVQKGEEQTMYPSVVSQHRNENIESPTERYSMANVRKEVLEQRIEALQDRFQKEMGNPNAIHIDLSDQKATLIQNGSIIAKYPVSSGAWETPTPKGKFQVYRKQELRISNLDVPYRMPYYMAFTPTESHGLHALPYLGNIATNSDYWHEALDHIGRPVSHGCVRFLPEDAEAVFEWAEVGTPVIIGT